LGRFGSKTGKELPDSVLDFGDAEAHAVRAGTAVVKAAANVIGTAVLDVVAAAF
jgi:hypothetical protein